MWAERGIRECQAWCGTCSNDYTLKGSTFRTESVRNLEYFAIHTSICCLDVQLAFSLPFAPLFARLTIATFVPDLSGRDGSTYDRRDNWWLEKFVLGLMRGSAKYY